MSDVVKGQFYDDTAEALILAGMFCWPESIGDLSQQLSAQDFFRPLHATIWTALVELHQDGAQIDHVSIANRSGLQTLQVVEKLPLVTASRPSPEHVNILEAHTMRRQIMAAAAEAIEQTRQMAAPGTVLDDLKQSLSIVGFSNANPEGVTTFSALIENKQAASPWIVKGMLRADTCVIIVSIEGGGKSTCLRQWAFCMSQGIHPFTFEPIEPLRVLMLDFENPLYELIESGEELEKMTKERTTHVYDSSRLVVMRRRQGAEIRQRQVRGEIEKVIRDFRPQVIVGGPIYKMSDQFKSPRETHEDVAAATTRVLDDWRERYGVAFILEHHAPMGDKDRVLRPINSVRWSQWPEMGLSLTPRDTDGALVVGKFRGNRGRFDWPAEFVRARTPGDWLWNPQAKAKKPSKPTRGNRPMEAPPHTDDDAPTFGYDRDEPIF